MVRGNAKHYMYWSCRRHDNPAGYQMGICWKRKHKGHILFDFHYCCVMRVECIGGDLYTTLSGLLQGVFIMWHFILNEHGGDFFQNKNKDITSYMMLQMMF